MLPAAAGREAGGAFSGPVVPSSRRSRELNGALFDFFLSEWGPRKEEGVFGSVWHKGCLVRNGEVGAGFWGSLRGGGASGLGGWLSCGRVSPGCDGTATVRATGRERVVLSLTETKQLWGEVPKL